jgi:hypothetical protein
LIQRFQRLLIQRFQRILIQRFQRLSIQRFQRILIQRSLSPAVRCGAFLLSIARAAPSCQKGAG